jgi:predicted RNA-binding Zn ribbon-like protein
MTKNLAIDQMRLDGGVFCLDFVNTIPDRFDGSNRDLLIGFEELAYFAKRAGIIDTKTLSQVAQIALSNPKKSQSFFKEAVELRGLIYRIFKSICDQKFVAPDDLSEFNNLLPKYLSLLYLESKRGILSERWNTNDGNYYSITAPIVKSAYELLLSNKLIRVKECSNCGWLFLDTSKNGKRRWCSMQACGSNVKALEYYHRKKLNTG